MKEQMCWDVWDDPRPVLMYYLLMFLACFN